MATHLLRDELLEHPVRETLYDVIRREPGIPFTGLFRRLKPAPGFAASLGHGSLDYHLYQLERFGLITSRRSGRHRRYYQNGGPQGSDTTALSVLQSEPVPELVRILVERPGQSQKEIWERLCEIRPRSRQVVGYHMERLRRAGLAAIERRGKRMEVRTTPRLLRLLPCLTGPTGVEEKGQPGYQTTHEQGSRWVAACAASPTEAAGRTLDVIA